VPNTPPTFDCGGIVHMMLTQEHALNPVASRCIGSSEEVTAGHSTMCHRGVAMPMWCSPTPAVHIEHSNANLNDATTQSRC